MTAWTVREKEARIWVKRNVHRSGKHRPIYCSNLHRCGGLALPLQLSVSQRMPTVLVWSASLLVFGIYSFATSASLRHAQEGRSSSSNSVFKGPALDGRNRLGRRPLIEGNTGNEPEVTNAPGHQRELMGDGGRGDQEVEIADLSTMIACECAKEDPEALDDLAGVGQQLDASHDVV